MTPLAPDELDHWLDNWARWLRDTTDCTPAGARIASAEKNYRSPQRWHHGTPAPDLPPSYPIQAELVEATVHGDTFPFTWRRSLIATWLDYPDRLLVANRIPADRWARKRAWSASLATRTYVEAYRCARTRLASILAPYRGSLP